MDAPDAPNDAGGSPSDAVTRLFEACKRLDVDAVLELLPEVGLRATDSDDNRYPMGIIARSQHPEPADRSSCPHLELFQHIKKRYPAEYAEHISGKDENGQIMASHAAISDCTIILDYLAKVEKCDLDEPGYYDFTPLISACQWGRVNSVRYLIQSGCRLDFRDKACGMNGLLWAAYYLFPVVVEEILKDPRSLPLMSQRSSEDENIVVNCVSSYDECTPDSGTCKHLQMINVIQRYCSESEFEESLSWKSLTGEGLVIRAINGNCDLILQFLKDRGCPLDEANNDGDTPLGEAACYGSCKALRILIESKCDIHHRSNSGETPFLTACRGSEFEAAKMLADAGADTTAKDLCENTALHLVCGSESDSFSKLFLWISGLDKSSDRNYEPMLEKMRAVNLSGHNIPLTLADSGALKSFIELGDIAKLKDQLSPTFCDSDGLNILHVYAAKHSLTELQEVFSRSPFADLWKDLISARVQLGGFKGYGCLHFASQTGHLENINYLLQNYPECMRLKERFISDVPSPMDVLIKHRHENLLPKLRFVSFRQLIESVDNVQSAFDLLPLDQAQKALLPLCNPELKTVVINPQAHKDEKYRSGRAEVSGGFIYPAGVKLFLLALREDSAEILRNIVALGLWNYLGTQRAADDVNAYICQLILKRDTPEATLADELPDSHRGFGHYLKWRPTDAQSVCFDLPSPSLLGIAIRSGRIKIAKDIIMLKQYHLIPTCLLTIEECKFLLEDGKALTECVEDLRSFALNVILNAMDELDKSADENRMRLLHMFLGGRFHPEGCKDPDCYGPKYLSLSRQAESSQFTLAIECGSDEVVASDCFMRCSKTEWAEPTIGQDTAVSPQTKFRIHSASFLIFMCLFTYFVIAMGDSTTWIDIIILLFAVSFAIQEAMQFFDSDDIWDYLTDGWNYLDIGGILLLLTSLCWKLYEDAVRSPDHYATSWKYFAIRMLLSIGHLIWGLRFISFLRSFELIGPTINIIKTLLKRDLLPFLIIFLSICLSFGIFFYNLLNPDMRVYTSSGMVGAKDTGILFSIMTRPLLTTFGNMDLGDVSSCEGMSADWLKYNATAASAATPAPACTHPIGTFHYRKYLLLPFLFLINLTMLNVLIAKFSMTVANQADVTYMIWRRGDADLLNDYVEAPTLPPPLTIFWVAFVLLRRLCRRCLNRSGGNKPGEYFYQPVVGDDGCERHRSWWPPSRMEKMLGQAMGKESDDIIASEEEKNFAASFREYLLYQACTFHGQRRKFTRARKDHGPAVEKLQIDIQNLSAR